MKRSCLLLCLLLLSGLAVQAQKRSCDLTIYGGITGTTITIDPAGLTPTYFSLDMENKGPDTIRLSDSIRLMSPFLAGGVELQISPLELPSGAVINIKDTFYFEAGPPAGIYEYCDTIWMVHSATDSAMDPDPTNNINCRSLTIVHKTTSISETFVHAAKTRKGVLSIMPNPATTLISFDFVAYNNSVLQARVRDLSGRQVLYHDYGRVYQGQSGFQLDISSLVPGIYFVSLEQEGVRFSGKLSRQ